jgi:hypothetical protein
MKKIFILFLSAFFALAACKKNNQATTYELGQNCLGGIVVQLDSTKEHGLVVALTDQVTYAQHLNWSQSKAACEAYTEGGAGWRLPVQAELELMYTQKATIGGFQSRDYWTSTLGGNNNAWSRYFGIPGGITTSNWKQLSNCTLCSRAVKEF